ncbi:MAG: hypothetical protein IPI07_11110 [Flavobacteriales bacterium]|nr:hypothetical protein [Flavobacteriales bacterium]
MDRAADGEAAGSDAQRTGLSGRRAHGETLLAQQHLSKAKGTAGLMPSPGRSPISCWPACSIEQAGTLAQGPQSDALEQYSAAITDLDRYIEKAVTPFVGFLGAAICHLGAGYYDLALKDLRPSSATTWRACANPPCWARPARSSPGQANGITAERVLKTEKRNGGVLAMMTKDHVSPPVGMKKRRATAGKPWTPIR